MNSCNECATTHNRNSLVTALTLFYNMYAKMQLSRMWVMNPKRMCALWKLLLWLRCTHTHTHAVSLLVSDHIDPTIWDNLWLLNSTMKTNEFESRFRCNHFAQPSCWILFVIPKSHYLTRYYFRYIHTITFRHCLDFAENVCSFSSAENYYVTTPQYFAFGIQYS